MSFADKLERKAPAEPVTHNRVFQFVNCSCYRLALAARLRSLRSLFSLIVSLGLLLDDFFFWPLSAIDTPPATFLRAQSGLANNLADQIRVRSQSIRPIVEEGHRNDQTGCEMIVPIQLT